MTRFRSKFQAQDPTSGLYLGVAGTMKEATDLVAEYTGESSELDDDKRLWLKGHNLIEHFNAWIKVFTDPSGEPAVPSDLMSAIENQKLCPELAKAAPALYYCSLMSKNGPFKENLRSKWLSTWSPESSESTLSMASKLSRKTSNLKTPKLSKLSKGSSGSLESLLSQTSLTSLGAVPPQDLTQNDIIAMIRILQVTFLDTAKDNSISTWTREVCRNSQHYSGWQMLLTRYIGVVKQVGSTFEAVTSPAKLQGAAAKLVVAHQVGQSLMSLGNLACISEYHARVEAIRTDIVKLNPPGIGIVNGYSPAWIIRSHVLCTLRSQGISRLKVPRGFTVSEFSVLFPDAKQWVERYFDVLFKKKKIMTKVSFKAFLAAIGYKHPPELLTMYFCLFGDKTLLRVPASTLIDKVLELRSVRIDFLRSTGVQPHPCTVAKSLKSRVS